MASKVSVVGIVAWVLVVILAIGAGALGFLFMSQSSQAAGLRVALQQVATTAGVQEWTPAAATPATTNAAGEAAAAPAAQPLTAAALAEAATLASVVQQVQTAIQGTQQELATTKDALTAAQSETSGAKTEAAGFEQKLQEQATALSDSTKELTAKDALIANLKEQAEQLAKELQDVKAADNQQRIEMAKIIEELRAQILEERVRWQAELEAARQAAPAVETATVAPAEGEAAPAAEGTEVVAEAAPAKEAAAAVAPVAEELPSRVIGQSAMITLIRYLPADQSMHLRLLDGQELTYHGVPSAIYDELVGNPEKLDMVYRFRIQGEYKSLPPDSVVVRKYYKWQRRHRSAAGDVRVIEPPAPPAAPAEETAPVEAAVEAAVAAPEAEAAPAEATETVEFPAEPAAPEAAPVEN